MPTQLSHAITSVASILLAACSSPSAGPANTGTTSPESTAQADVLPDATSTPASTARASTTSATSDAPSDACPEVKARFEKELAAAPGTCKADADCDCFPGAVAKGFACGGMTDKIAAAKLHDIFREFRAAKCRGPNCAAQACVPKCKDGRCVSG